MTKTQKHILCSIQTSLTKQLKVKVHPEKQAGWCQGRRPWERDQGGTRLKRTQLGPRWASETLGHLLPKRCLLSGNPLQKPQEIREENSMQSKTSLFIEMILLHWQSWGAVMQKHAFGKERFFFPDSTPQKRRKESKQERKNTPSAPTFYLLDMGFLSSDQVWHSGHLERKERTPKQDFLDEQGHEIPGTTQTIVLYLPQSHSLPYTNLV